MTASITSRRQNMGGDNGNMAMLPWLPFHNRLMKLTSIKPRLLFSRAGYAS